MQTNNSENVKPKRKIIKPRKYQTTESSDDAVRVKKRKDTTRMDEMKAFFDKTKAVADDDQEMGNMDDLTGDDSEYGSTDTSDSDENVDNNKNNEKQTKKVKSVDVSNKPVQSTQRSSNLNKGINY